MPSPVSMYRIFRREGVAASVRPVIVALVLLALALTTIGIIRVTRQHEVMRLGFVLSKKSEEVRKLREVRRQLELEHATLSAPDRIRRLALRLGMTTVAPDRIRTITAMGAPLPPAPPTAAEHPRPRRVSMARPSKKQVAR